jgi:hypothetical protein
MDESTDNGPIGPNDKVYIHEFIDIIGHNRANYMHHMTANWSPIAQDERHQLCYGVWGVVGTTRGWPEVVNIWEEDGFPGLSSSFEHEFNHPSLQDPKLAKWWSEAANYRRHGDDRVLIPAPWMPTIEQLCAAGTSGETYAHEQVHVPHGTSRDFLDAVAQEAIAAYEPFGWQLVGAWETAMVNESECFLMWAIPSWAQWGEAEAGERTDAKLGAWRRHTYDLARAWHRFLLVDAPLSPMRTGRQPSRDDRHEGWDED